MPKLVNISAKPYSLSTEQIHWVEDTLDRMSTEEKCGQLFTSLFWFGVDTFSGNALTNEQILEKYHIGGARWQGGKAKDCQELLNSLQSASKIPLLVAANCDFGGNGACADGTYIASGAQCEATRDPQVAYNAGYVSAREAGALGVNVNFDPCVDILFNWRNTIVNTRAYGTNADDVIRYTSAYIEGYRAGAGGNMVTCFRLRRKHFPGYAGNGAGTEERDPLRDPLLVLVVNELTPEQWDASFGRVYRHHINHGVEMIMAGHIALPYYSKQLDPSLLDEDIMPATLAPELITGLLKEQLGFNGMVITDASHMLGMTSAMRREDYVPRAIASGVDMFLFFNDIDEDFNFMLNGYRKGIISEERMNDAVRRVLGLKAKLNLPKKQAQGALLMTGKDLAVVGCAERLCARHGGMVGYGAQNNYHVQWKSAMSNECPWYVWEVPTVMVSLNFTTRSWASPNSRAGQTTWCGPACRGSVTNHNPPGEQTGDRIWEN